MFQAIKRLFSQIGGIQQLSQVDQVRRLVPSDAQYVTVSTIGIAEPNSQLLSQKPQLYSAATIAEWTGLPMEASYLVHNGQDIKVISVQGERYSAPLADIVQLHRFSGGGFVLILRSGAGIVTSTAGPVKTSPDMQFRTPHGLMDMTSGWLKELEPFSVQVID